MQLEPDIHLVDGVNSNTYLIADSDGLTIIDTGMPGSAKGILAYIQKLGHQPGDLKRILLTHQHIDHVGGAAELARQTGAEVWAHPLDTPAIEGKAQREAPHGVVGILFRLVLLPRIQAVPVTRTVYGEETLPVLADAGGLRVIETHGHTKGQVSFYNPGRRILFAGDAYMHGSGTMKVPMNMLNLDTNETRKSFARLKTLDVEASYPGHGKPISHGAGAVLTQAAG